MSDEKKKLLLLIAKIVAVCVFSGAYFVLFIQGLYKFNGEIVWGRIFVPTLLLIIPSVLLFIKIKIPEKINIIISIVFSAFVVIESFVMIQYSQGYPYSGWDIRLEIFNLYIIATIFVVLYAIFNSFKAAIIGLSILNTVFGLSNYFVVRFRGTGLLAVDVLNIKTAANVASGYTYTLSYGTHLLVMSSLAICFLAVKLGKNTFTPKKWRVLPILLAICMTVGFYGIFFGTTKYDKLLKVKYYKPQETFKLKGMYTTFVKSIKDLIVEAPEGYSIEAVQDILKEYPQTAATVDSEKAPNIIMIMDEAFTDFESFTDLKINQDCMPFYHSLKENAIKGQLFVSIFGGGTAATEFEVLTSNSMAFIPNGITAYTTYINDPMASAATTLANQNYGGMLSMHPYKGNGYKRDKVYPLLGFDRFITEDDFAKDTNIVGKHISDVADVERIISEYEDYRKENDNPFFMFNVTIQNHSPFTSKGVSDDIKLEYDIDNIPEANQYMNLMKHTDDALKELVEYFEKSDEPTLILFFGDHEPKLEDAFYKEVKKGYTLDEVYTHLRKRNTQFVLWANYDIEEQADVYISANYLTSLVMDTAGLAKSSYQQFVDEVHKQVPILTKYGYVGADGNFYSVDDKKSPYYEILHKYNILEYNNIFDVSHRVDEVFDIQ